MLQTLLEDRFHLKWHREPRDGAAYALTLGNSGAKLPAAHAGASRMKLGDLDTSSMSVDQLCQILEFDLDRPVVNRTGLSGNYALKLAWASERAGAGQTDLSQPSLFTAVQEQLGLKLEGTRAPVDMFVIDDAQAPSEN